MDERINNKVGGGEKAKGRKGKIVGGFVWIQEGKG